ncbi:MAG TPA: hypothetical protein VEF04_06485, partial [Blastocatellia bacterium]|nr:hypothetical protein [Blastocatellia bacterium]
SAKPLAITGRYSAAAKGTIKLRGKVAGRDFVREIPVNFPESESKHDVLATLWARTKIDDLMMQGDNNPEQRDINESLREQITQLGLQYKLMTQYTSFVAVEEKIITDGSTPRRVEVPVEMPEGVSYEGVFGEKKELRKDMIGATRQRSNMQMLQMSPGTVSETVTVQGNAPRLETSPTQSSADLSRRIERDKEEPKAATPKLHASLTSLVQKAAKNDRSLTADETKFAANGKADIQIWLVNKTPQAIAELKKLGFVVTSDPQGSNLIVGQIAIEKLAKLTELASVRFIAPYYR